MTDTLTEVEASPERIDPIRVVGGVVRDSAGKILIAQRHHGRLDGYWEFPGGKVDPGETEESALVREFQEEFDIDVEPGSFLAENNHVYPKIEQYPEVAINLRIFNAVLRGTGKINLTAHGDYKWVTEEELKNYNFAPADIPFVTLLLENKMRSEAMAAVGTTKEK